jgi:hypothetical protein
MARRKIQWHPLFTRLLRPHIEGYYEVRTDLPVGDLPRQADIVLLRRTTTGSLPFQGLWRHLTSWNILEFKGPTVTPRHRDLSLLTEVGLGISRRLNAERRDQGRRPLPESEVSFWYLANQIGRTFLRDAAERLAGFEVCGQGLWRGQVLGCSCYLVSTVALPVDDDSLPLHLLGREPAEKVRQVARFVVEEDRRLTAYGGALSALHPRVWKEVRVMAKGTRRDWILDIRPAVDFMGIDKAIEQIGEKEILDHMDKKRVLERMDVEDIFANLTPAKRQKLKRLLEASG